MIFGLLGVVVLRRIHLGLVLRLVVPLRPAGVPFLVVVWEVELLATVVPADCTRSATVMNVMLVLLSTLSTPLLLRYFSFVGVLSLLLMS